MFRITKQLEGKLGYLTQNMESLEQTKKLFLTARLLESLSKLLNALKTTLLLTSVIKNKCKLILSQIYFAFKNLKVRTYNSVEISSRQFSNLFESIFCHASQRIK
jgi:hypothetical protein